MTYYVYLARCADDTLYCGVCKDLKEREQKHNDGTGAKYTRTRLPVQFVYTEKYPSRSEAMKREYEIKQWPREKKEELIS